MREHDKPRVLVVDVDDDLRATLCELLAEAGFRASCVPDVDSARQRLPTNPPDVLLLCWDVHAGAHDKAALLDEVPSGVPVILMSTHPSVAKVAAARGVPFLTKPFDIDDFVQTVARVSRPPTA